MKSWECILLLTFYCVNVKPKYVSQRTFTYFSIDQTNRKNCFKIIIFWMYITPTNFIKNSNFNLINGKQLNYR